MTDWPKKTISEKNFYKIKEILRENSQLIAEVLSYSREY